MDIFPKVGVDLGMRGLASYQSQVMRLRTMNRGISSSILGIVDASHRANLVLAAIGGAATIAGAGILSLIRPLATLGDESQRVERTMQQVAHNLEVSTDVLDDQTQKMRDLHLTTSTARETLTRLMVGQTEVAKASELAAIALDLEALYGVKAEKALKDLTFAITNQTTATLNQYGISIRATRIFDAWAKSVNKTGDELTTVERRQAMLNYVLRVGESVAGAYNATIGTTSWWTRKLRADAQELASDLGRYLLPGLTSIIKRADELVARFSNLPPAVQEVSVKILALVGGVLSLGGAIALATPAVRVIWTAIKALPAVILTATTALGAFNPILLAVLATGAVAVGTNFGGLGDRFKELTKALGESLAEGFQVARAYAVGFYESVIVPIGDAISRGSDAIKSRSRELTNDDFGFNFPEVVHNFFISGSQMMAALALGILEGATYVVESTAWVAQVVADFLIGLSPPVRGPLKDIDKGGLALINSWINGMYEADLTQIEDLVSRVEETLLRPLWKIQDALFDIKIRSLALDKSLWPYEDQLKRIEALIFRTTLPWVRQRRETQKQLELLRDIVDQQKKQAQIHLKYLERQIELMKDVVQQDRERLEFIDHEIFMEDLRNRILKRAGSARLLELQSEKRVASDQLALDQRRLKDLQDELKAEKERLDTLKTIAELQIQVLEKQERLLTRLITAEEDRVTWQREELKLAQALQIEERLRLETQKRTRDEQLMWAQHYNETISRANKLLRALKKGLDDTGESWEDLFSKTRTGLADLVDDVKNKLFPPLSRQEIEAAKKALAEPWEGVREQMARLKTAIGELTASWGQMGDQVEIKVTPKVLGFFSSLHLLDDYFKDTIVMWWHRYFVQPLIKAKAKINEFIIWFKHEWPETMGEIGDAIRTRIIESFEKLPDWIKAWMSLFGIKAPFSNVVPDVSDYTPATPEGGSTFGSVDRVSAQMDALVRGFAGQRATRVINNYNTSPGPTVNLEAHYADVQSPATITQDLDLMFQLVG